MLNGLINDLAFYFDVGGYVMPPLFASAFILWFAIGFRFAELRRGSVRSVRQLISRHAKGQRHAPRGLIDTAVVLGLEIRRREPPDLRRWLDDAFADYESATKRFHTLILSIVAVAPVLGLLGTVNGMIETFDSLGDMSLFAQSGGIAGGISQALFTTQMGLAVAIPGLVVGGLLDRKALRLRQELAQVKDLLCAPQHDETAS
ncbi:MotA/TolQ/ExbB proton channel family protein [Wenzhouxiangella marina]|uniref:MotA/TolQ/ExbB proton channel n=1 Tax=Wenzhouxiangella marina TaxID=1579979 RepID=A0A0K0XX94_9GAMM|nr:MotA/TolQ/ExbB proton channel family protein [Wenzhouxiangella marina]AKS42231.1 MotA/TolQ/ExbB proton channel [Wenzhouxiangella marina]MBB6085997.1 biopolymer transport protein ExbB [Wenzhouxiangella marina]